MNREIKFRAWSADQMHYTQDENRNTQSMFTAGDILDRFETVMQYTGLKDTDGKEIYEEDFLMDDSRRTWIVKWNPHDCKFVKFLQKERARFDGRIGQLQSPLQDYTCVLMKVIGNIYQNPELLKNSIT